ncbi:MAG: hypothetical protein AB8D78_01785 [Akkermansiaceae bacterium]
MSGNQQHHPHIGIASFVSGLMALALAAGLEYLKLIDRFDLFLQQLLTGSGLSAPSRSLPWLVTWSGVALLSFFVAAVMLNVAATWRRVIVWGLTLLLTFFWGPVLLIAAYRPEIGVALIAVLWSGFCAMIYANNHELPADLNEASQLNRSDGAR